MQNSRAGKRSSSFTWKSSCLQSKLQSFFFTCIRNILLLSQGSGNSLVLAGSPCCWPGEGLWAHWPPLPQSCSHSGGQAAGKKGKTGPGAISAAHSQGLKLHHQTAPSGIFKQASAKSPSWEWQEMCVHTHTHAHTY